MPTSTLRDSHAAEGTDVSATAGRLRLAVSRLGRKMRRNADAGISLSQLSALVAIERVKRLTIGDLAATEQVRPPTMTKIAASLEEAGLVRREPDPGDRRVGWLSLTPEGSRRLARIRGRKNAFLATRLEALSPSEIRLIERALPLIERLAEEPD